MEWLNRFIHIVRPQKSDNGTRFIPVVDSNHIEDGISFIIDSDCPGVSIHHELVALVARHYHFALPPNYPQIKNTIRDSPLNGVHMPTVNTPDGIGIVTPMTFWWKNRMLYHDEQARAILELVRDNCLLSKNPQTGTLARYGSATSPTARPIPLLESIPTNHYDIDLPPPVPCIPPIPTKPVNAALSRAIGRRTRLPTGLVIPEDY